MSKQTWLFAGVVALAAVGTHAATAVSLPDFTQLVEKEGRAVVNVSTTATLRDPGQGIEGLDEDTLNLFRRFGFPLPPMAPQGPRERHAQSLGSGFIIDAAGYILTNAHVIAEADEIKVKLEDKREFKATVVGSDARTDVALLKIEATNLPKVDLGNPAQLKVGEWVAAIGSPFGLENTVTAGIVSAKGRSLPDETYVPFIQTDVAINPGNSGGPLFNLKGEVIGINSQIYSRSGGYMGLSFAIPIDVAMKVAEQLKTNGKVSRGKIGVSIQEVNEELAKSFGLPKASGALVSSVEKDGPADKAGLKPGDIVLRFNGQEVSVTSDLPRLVTEAKPGSTARLQVWRDRAARELNVTVGEMDQPDRASAGREYRGGKKEESNRFGLTLREFNNPRHLKELGIKYGLVVQGASGAAARAGLQQGDVIVGIGGQELSSSAQLKKALDELKPGQTLPLRVLRSGASLFISLKAPEK
ncbi:DegQ family serine endoprotease [Chitiniphilus purpureus]|uniref:Probable periplasmic serine endoprotease DegP-like n=1 Tax=Chitiniphilus purpureus TaxID=2981137 RepID=A0ABY6DPD0_9NEIS|nr:DegQ family serine endoprotease [Chitiniphilus sp. CD1]UXY13768.1 DegQ family serine endoprotease [Chitiniphilus sp. CD1]